MARKPEISEDEYEKLLGFVESLGYDVSKVERVPQRW
jgi:apolipoprotein D and lipocalin family protein